VRRHLPLLALCACHAVEKGSAPDLTGAQSAVLVALGAQEQAIGVPAGEDGLHLPAIVQRSDLELWALTFSCPLDRTGLPAGAIPIGSTAADVGFELPPLATYATTLAKDGPVAWSAAEPDEALQSALDRMPAVDVCTTAGRFGPPKRVILPNPDTEVYAFTVRTDPDHVVVAAQSGNLYRIARDGSVEKRTLETVQPFVAAFVRDDGTTYAVDRAGQTYIGSFDEGFEVLSATASVAAGADSGQLVGPRSNDDGPFELFLVASGNQRSFSRFDGDRWTLLASRSGNGDPIISAAWVGPGEAIAFDVERDADITRYKNGAVSSENIEGRGAVTSVLQHPRYGTVATVATGRFGLQGLVFIYSDGAWREQYEVQGYPVASAAVGPAIWVTRVVGFNPPASFASFWDEARGVCGEVDDNDDVILVDGYNRDLVAIDEQTYVLVNQIDFFGTFFADVLELEAPFVSCNE
jgi:hypothetical protein